MSQIKARLAQFWNLHIVAYNQMYQMAEKPVRKCWENQIDHCLAALGGGENYGAVRPDNNSLFHSVLQLLC